MIEYSNLNIQQLKSLGHKFLDEYVNLDRERTPKEARHHAYEKLAQRSGSILNYGKVHFSKMETRKEIIHAISTLRDMIRRRKNKYKFRQNAEFADPELVKTELNKIKKKKSNLFIKIIQFLCGK